MVLVWKSDRKFFVSRQLQALRNAESDKASAELKAAFDKFEETKNDTKANTPATEALVAELRKLQQLDAQMLRMH